METTSTTKVTSPTVIGLILSLVLIVLGQVTIVTNQIDNKILTNAPMLIAVGVLIWACINYSKQKDHDVTFGNVFGFGFKIVATVTALMAVYTILLFKVINPELIDYTIEKSREAMEKQGNSTEDMEKGLSMMKNMFVPFAVVGVILIYGIGGTIVALIGAAVAKKQPKPNPF